MVVPGVGGDALEIQATLRLEPPAGSGLRMKTGGRGRPARAQFGRRAAWGRDPLGRPHADRSPAAACDLPAEAGCELTLDVFLDKSLLEVFANGGRVAMTRIIYPPAEDLAVEVFAEQGTTYVDASTCGR